MGIYSFCISFVILQLKLTQDLSHSISVMSTTNISHLDRGTTLKTAVYSGIHIDHIVEENNNNTTEENKTTDTVLIKKIVRIEDYNDMVNNDEIMKIQTGQNAKITTISNIVQSENGGKLVLSSTTTADRTGNYETSTGIFTHKETGTDTENGLKKNPEAWNFTKSTSTSYTIINNSNKAKNAHISSWTTQCLENCICFKDISDLGSHFDPPIKLNTSKKTVNCNACEFNEIPLKVPTETDVLYLSSNNISKLDHLPYLPKLIVLDLSNNHIRMISSYGLFAKAQNLKSLILFHNQLRSLEPGSFSGLIKLDNLDLGFNQVSSIHPNAFVGLNHLKMLNLQGNQLAHISVDCFRAVVDIRELDLSMNFLNVVPAKTFDPLTNLYSLNLADNKIRTLDLEIFTRLEKMKMLNLSNNQITQVPSYQICSAKSLGRLILNGNPITRIRSGDFFNSNIISISICYMKNLMVIEKLAFHDLPLLESLFAHDNPKLVYIDHSAFALVPNLKRLYIHNNELSAVSPSMLAFLPNLEEIHLYHNPLQCDCNAFWIKKVLDTAKQTNHSKPYLSHSQFIKCTSPFNVTGKSIMEVNGNFFPRVCSPTTLQLFSEEYQLDLGEELQLECHAFGIPDPIIVWSLPNGTIIDPSAQGNRIMKPGDKISLIDDCVLTVKHLSINDSGTYSCKSDNGFGFDISSTKVIISNKPVRLFPYTINSNFISISWNGTQHKSMISDYQLHYREVVSEEQVEKETESSDVSVIQLGPQYHSYTVTKLQPNTKYEFCLVYLYKSEKYKVDCQNISTQAHSGSIPGVQKLISNKLVIGISTTVGLTILLTCIIMLVKKFCGQKQYEIPYDSDESETINIPLDNIYQPLFVPVCSSKTSLLTKNSE